MASTKIINKFILLNSKGENDIIDITDHQRYLFNRKTDRIPR